MKFEGKWELARQIALALGTVALRNTEKLSLHVLKEDRGRKNAIFGPATGRGHVRKFFNFLEKQEAGSNLPLEKGIEAALSCHAGRGIVLILSDFLTFGDLKRSFNLLFSSGLEIWGLQICFSLP